MNGVTYYEIICDCGDVAEDEAAICAETPYGPEVQDFVVGNHHGHDYELGDRTG